MDGKQIVRQYEALAAERGTWEQSWQNIADHIVGKRDFNTTYLTGGRSRQRKIYDGTARFSVSALSGGLHSLLTNPAAEWFHLSTEDPRLMDDHDVAIWVEDAKTQMYNAITSPANRFATQVHESYTENVAFGTMGFFVGDEPGQPIMFSSRALEELYFSENSRGVVDTVFRKFKYTAQQAVDRWGKDAPEKAHNDIKSGATQNERYYLHMVRPANSPLPLPFKPSGLPWESAFIYLDDKKIVQTGGYHEMPYMIARWEKDPSETYGRGPGFTALPDATMLNEMKKTMLQTGTLKVRPPMMTEDEELILDLRPGAKNVVTPGAMNPPIQPLNVGGDLGWGVELLNDTRQQVQNAFHWDLLQLIRDPRMTATQVLEISAQIRRLLAPVLGRQETEFLDPLLNRVFGILLRRGAFLPPPPALRGAMVKVEYVSPVAIAQKEEDTRAIVDLFTVGANLAQSDPSVLDVLDSEEALRMIGRNKGTPPQVLRSRETVDARREARAEAQSEQAQRQQAMETAQVSADVLSTLNQAGVV